MDEKYHVEIKNQPTNAEIEHQWSQLPVETKNRIRKEFGELMGEALWFAFAKTYGFKK